MQALDTDNIIIKEIIEEMQKVSENVGKMKDYTVFNEAFNNSANMNKPELQVDMGEGKIVLNLTAVPDLFYKVLSLETNEEITDDFKLLSYMRNLKAALAQYNMFKDALKEVEDNGYGIVSPTVNEMTLEEPEIVKQGSRFGVRLKASAPSLHIMKVNVETEVNPIVGSEQQGEDMVKYLLSEFENNKKGIWDTNMFGKSLNSLVKEGLTSKLHAVPIDVLNKMRKTMGRIVNEGKGGVLCILL
jgi:stage IV sporulation protein A